ncbi:hypothetical protein [Sphingomonas beigongshangi]|uniref:hypothetical protein n=1 Tax=Sphingomonas beigongshangi TaxID=2782540 RepID=UPI00193C3FB2|nr:hypothetical protein [Sphingomonas beigongshangi]
MAAKTRYGNFLMMTSASLVLAACGGADNVASPGAGSVTIVQPAPAPSPTPTPTPTAAITAAQFAAATTVNGITVTADEQLAIVNAGSNNNVNGTGSTINGIYPTSATSLATASDPARIDGFFTSTNYVGAFNGPTDTSFQGWTCNSTSAEFGGSGARCTAVPAVGTLASGASCPSGTNTPTGTTTGAANVATVGGFKVCDIPQAITTSLTLPRIPGIAYRFTGQTEVGTDVGTTGANSGVTLTIEPGVVIFANANESTNDLLLVNRGSRIQAVGTATAPIIFTSQQNMVANGVSDASQGQWGGIILLGRAPTGVCRSGTGPNNAAGSSTTCEQAIEGVTGRFYGGPNAADSSGQMSYVQIRYSGIAISDGNELQGLTLGGTGSGTVIDHVQSHNSADDGVEIFGGNTNIKYFAVTGADDDGFDIDNGYRGFMQFIVAAQRVLGATADSFSTEIDSNNAEDLLPRTFSTFANFTFIQTALAPAAIRQRGGSDMRFVNGVVKTPASVACVNIIAGEQTAGGRTTVRPADSALQDFGPPSFNSVYFACNGR